MAGHVFPTKSNIKGYQQQHSQLSNKKWIINIIQSYLIFGCIMEESYIVIFLLCSNVPSKLRNRVPSHKFSHLQALFEPVQLKLLFFKYNCWNFFLLILQLYAKTLTVTCFLCCFPVCFYTICRSYFIPLLCWNIKRGQPVGAPPNKRRDTFKKKNGSSQHSHATWFG